ncbi:DNA polymerase III subunit beta [Paenibacillus sp. FSL R5-0407]|uniref:DNA polymerase III subunit beta n=1 Tax=Paenibacillus sp. FSL R5-0407 TaxID=2975320 RepID=UPI0030F514E0
MKITILKQWLNEAIQHVSKAISSKTTIPILTGVKLDVTDQGVTLTASDIDTTIQASIPAETQDGAEIVKIERTGSVVLPAKFFVEIIKKLPKDEVSIETDASFTTTIKSGKTKIDMVGMDPEEFPVVPALSDGQTISIPGSDLKDLIKETAFAISTNESSPILTGVKWELQPGKLNLLATDRHRLATAAMEIDEKVKPATFVISGKTLNELIKIIPDKGEPVGISVSKSQVLFRIGEVQFYSRLLDGTFPDTSKIVPTSFKSELVVKTKSLVEALDRAFLMAREEKTNIVRIEAAGESAVSIESASSGLGKVNEQLEAESIDGDAVRISFNCKYMLDALKVIDSEHVKMGFTGAMSPIIVTPTDGKESLYLILPYRTAN